MEDEKLACGMEGVGDGYVDATLSWRLISGLQCLCMPHALYERDGISCIFAAGHPLQTYNLILKSQEGTFCHDLLPFVPD
jgi:hypothetical protein